MAMLLGASLYGYAAVSAVVTGAVVANAVSTREQFYGSVVHLCSSKGSLMVRVFFFNAAAFYRRMESDEILLVLLS